MVLGNPGLLGDRPDSQALRGFSAVERQDQHGQGDIEDYLRVDFLCT